MKATFALEAFKPGWHGNGMLLPPSPQKQRRGEGGAPSSNSNSTLPPQASHPVENRQGRHRPAAQQTRRHAQNQRPVALIHPMHNPDGLQDAESAERDHRDAFVALLAPDSDDLGHEQQRVTPET